MSNESCINVSTNVEQLIFRNIKRKYFGVGEPTIYIRGKNTVIGTMEVDGYYSLDTTKNSTINHILVEGASINQLSISNATISRTYKHMPNNSVLLNIKKNGNVNYLQFNRINTVGIASIVSNTTGKLNIINASNIIHVNATDNYPFYFNNAQNEIKAFTLSNFCGSDLIDGGASKILRKKGDAF